MTGRRSGIGKHEYAHGYLLKPKGGRRNRPVEGLGRNAKSWCYECDSEHRWGEPHFGRTQKED